MPSSPEKGRGSRPAHKMVDVSRQTYRSFRDLVRFRDDDPLWVMGYKLVLHLLGVLFMILLSPFVLIGLIIAFLAVL